MNSSKQTFLLTCSVKIRSALEVIEGYSLEDGGGKVEAKTLLVDNPSSLLQMKKPTAQTQEGPIILHVAKFGSVGYNLSLSIIYSSSLASVPELVLKFPISLVGQHTQFTPEQVLKFQYPSDDNRN